MRKKHILILLLVLTTVFTAGLLLFPQLKNGGQKSSGYALARTPSKTAVPVVVAMAATEPFPWFWPAGPALKAVSPSGSLSSPGWWCLPS